MDLDFATAPRFNMDFVKFFTRISKNLSLVISMKEKNKKLGNPSTRDVV